jgi:hypothetical protein
MRRVKGFSNWLLESRDAAEEFMKLVELGLVDPESLSIREIVTTLLNSSYPELRFSWGEGSKQASSRLKVTRPDGTEPSYFAPAPDNRYWYTLVGSWEWRSWTGDHRTITLTQPKYENLRLQIALQVYTKSVPYLDAMYSGAPDPNREPITEFGTATNIKESNVNAQLGQEKNPITLKELEKGGYENIMGKPLLSFYKNKNLFDSGISIVAQTEAAAMMDLQNKLSNLKINLTGGFMVKRGLSGNKVELKWISFESIKVTEVGDATLTLDRDLITQHQRNRDTVFTFELGPNSYEVEISPVGRDSVNVEFRADGDREGLTGGGQPLRVISTVFSLVKSWLREHPERTRLAFVPSDQRRLRIYLAYVKEAFPDARVRIEELPMGQPGRELSSVEVLL